MKIVFLTSYLSESAGGISFSVPGLARSLTKLGADVTIVGLCEKNKVPSENFANMHVLPCEVIGPLSFGYSKTLISTIKSLNPDIIHLHHIWMYPSIANRIVSSKLSVPYVISPRGMVDDWALRNSKYKKLLSKLIVEKSHFQSAACIHALCKSEADSIRNFGFKGVVSIIPNGIDPAIGASGRVNKKSKTLIYLGRLDKKKGVHELLSAWKAMSDLGGLNGWSLTIAGYGDSDYIVEIQRLIIEFKLHTTVKYIGPIFGLDKKDLLSIASALILPSKSEGLPMAILEAWASSTVTLITPQCNLSESFEEGAAIEIGSRADEILPGLKILFESTEDNLSKIAVNADELLKSKFTWKVVGQEMLNMYVDLV